MKYAYSASIFLCLATTLFSQSHGALPVTTSRVDPKAEAKILSSYRRLPLTFEANHGQASGQVKFISRTGAYTLFLTSDEALLSLNGKKTKVTRTQPTSQSGLEQDSGGILRIKFRNTNPDTKVAGLNELSATNNYFIGSDPTKWRTNIATYAKVRYQGIYSGIDLVYYGVQRQLEYDFVVAPGADPSRIAFDVLGAKRIRRDARGELVFSMSESEIRWRKPVVYQEKDGVRQLVAARYVLTATNRVGFGVEKYDARRPLYIDPVIYSSYLGGSAYLDEKVPAGIVVDGAGYAYVTGWTNSADFPTTPGAIQTVCSAYCWEAFVTKFNPEGSGLAYSTYLGGSYQNGGISIAVDSSGDAYVTGYTDSPDFPVTSGALQTTYGGGSGGFGDGDAFVSKLNSTGTALIYSTYLGGSDGDEVFSIALDSSGDAYVTGYTDSPDFPTTPGAFQTIYDGGVSDGFVAEVNTVGSALIYSTFLLGSTPAGIATDNMGSAYVTGIAGPGLPVTSGAYQTTCCGAFVTKFNPLGTALVYSTYIGGNDSGTGIAVDAAGYAYVTGGTNSTDFPTTPGAFQTIYGGGSSDAFVFKLNQSGSALVYSTYLGGSGIDFGSGIALDSTGDAYVTGVAGTHFPTECPSQKHYGGGKSDAFVSKLNPTGTALVCSTYLGGSARDSGAGIAVDSSGDAYVVGFTESTNFPTTSGAFNPADCINCVFVTKLQLLSGTTTTLTSSPNPSALGQSVSFTAAVTSGAGAPPDGESISFMKGSTVLGTGVLSGGSASLTTSTLKSGTNSIKAVYGGDSTFVGSTSKVLKQVVTKTVEQ